MEAVECARLDRAAWTTPSLVVRGTPQFTMIRWTPLENSNERQLAPASAETGGGGERPTTPTTSARPAPLPSYSESGAGGVGWPRLLSLGKKGGRGAPPPTPPPGENGRGPA